MIDEFDVLTKVLNKEFVQDYKKLFNKMCDEKSKICLFNRVMYDNTNDTNYSINMIKNMYNGSSFISKSDRKMYKYINFLEKNNNYDKKICFFGIGYNKEKKDTLMWEFLTLIGQTKNGLNIEGIFNDDYDFILDMYLKKEKVKSIDTFYNLDVSNDLIFVIIDSKYNYIEKYLLDNNISPDNIFIFDNLIQFTRERQYLDEPFINFKDNEVFIDGGSSNLETTLGFINVVENKYEKIYAIEPYQKDYNECNRLINDYNLKNIETVNCGLWSTDETLFFNPIGFGSSYIGNDGTEKIDCRSIDSILNGNRASIIKMDIEGSEMNAIIGAKETIKKYHPVLMICVYHKPNDVLKLTKTVFDIRDDYDLYLRHYSYTKNETVLYFIPSIN